MVHQFVCFFLGKCFYHFIQGGPGLVPYFVATLQSVSFESSVQAACIEETQIPLWYLMLHKKFLIRDLISQRIYLANSLLFLNKNYMIVS